ncbi:MAG: tetratricopeptide repeat protein [Chloroflexi bacterium]|nr:tetratricopeptide repeat protein [Chloroflexota bacterium]
MEDDNLQQHSTALLTAWEDGTLSYHDAIVQFNALRGEAQTRGQTEDEAFLESRLGVIEGYRGNYVGSIAHFERARDLYLRANNRRQVATCTLNIGETYRLKGNFARARQYFRIGLDAAVELGDRETQVLARTNESQMMLSQGNAAQAEANLRECYALCEEPFPVPPGVPPEVVVRKPNRSTRRHRPRAGDALPRLRRYRAGVVLRPGRAEAGDPAANRPADRLRLPRAR